MRLSTGIILSILSANVFAIEHPNDAHSSSLLARRAVVADTDGVFLQKRGDDEGKKKQAKSKHLSVTNSGKGRHVYTKGSSKGDPNSESNSSDEAEEDFKNLTADLLNKNGGATGGREDVHTTIDSNQEESGFVDVIGDLPLQFIKYFKNKFNRGTSKSGSTSGMNKALAASQKTAAQFGGEMGESIDKGLYEMFRYALTTARGYQNKYNSPAKSPFDLKLPSTVLGEPKKEYEDLREEASGYIELYIRIIEDIINNISTTPENVIRELEEMMKSTMIFYTSVLDMVSRYSSLLELLGIFDDTHIQAWIGHLGDIKTYESELAGYFKIIKQMVVDASQSSNQQGSSKSSSFMLRFRKP
ncbi:hypothetical protein BASA81_006268 [Batrachochytrium salamandrivorans]|nr:hypothetical protein BASA81_006268 [Batrachochytrium salamandrivorans]